MQSVENIGTDIAGEKPLLRAGQQCGREIFTAPALIVPALIAGVYIAARLWHLGFYAMDHDEVFSLLAARHSFTNLIAFAADDIVHPPLFYLLLKVWRTIGGESLLWLRLFPALTSIAAIIPFLLLSGELHLRAGETNLALALLAANGYLVEYAQDLRMYSLLLALTLCSLWLFAKFFNSHSGTNTVPVALFVVNLLLIYTHYYGWLVVGVEFVFLLLRGRRKLLPFLISLGALAVCFAPWAYAVSRVAARKKGLGQNLDWISRPEVSDLTWFYATLNGSFEFRRSTTLGLLLFGFPVLVWGWRVLKGKSGDNAMRNSVVLEWLLLLAFLPVGISFFVSRFLSHSVWGDRYLIIVAAPYLMIVALAVFRLRPRSIRIATTLLIVGWAALAGFGATTRTDKKIAWDVLARHIIEAEPSRASDARVYTFEDFVAYPLRFSFEAMGEKTFRVIRAENIDGLQGQHFWVAFRNTSWRQERQPQDILAGNGWRVGEVFWTGTRGQQIGLFPVSP